MGIIRCTHSVLNSPPGQEFLCVMGSKLGSVISGEIICDLKSGGQLPKDLDQALGGGFLLKVVD